MKIRLTQLFKASLIVAAALFILPSQGISQRIAIVDIEQIMNSIPEYQAAQSELDQMASRWRQEINQQYDQIKSMYNKYQAEQVLMSDEARVQREEEIMAKEKAVRDLQKARFGPDGALFQQRQALVQPIQDKVYAAIEEYANDRGFDLIIDKSSTAGIIFTKDAFDKTQDIIKKIQ
jgi:outer membrane protein